MTDAERMMDMADGAEERRVAGIPPMGFRLPQQTRLGPVTLQVADLARSTGYYREVLGLSEIGAGDGSVRFGAADGVVLVELRERPGVSPVPRRGRLGLYHFALLLPTRAALGAFLTHLGEMGIRPGMADHDVSEALYLTDPDGLGIEIYTDRPRNEWGFNGRELHMTTDPLDVQGVIAAASDPWSGMPAGTGMGHVHLFVGDLDRAASFYHDAVGFDRTVWSYPGALFMSAGGYHHHLGTNIWAAGADAAGPDDARLLEWVVILPSEEAVAGALKSVEAAGYPVEREERGWTAADPWGTMIRVATGEG